MLTSKIEEFRVMHRFKKHKIQQLAMMSLIGIISLSHVWAHDLSDPLKVLIERTIQPLQDLSHQDQSNQNKVIQIENTPPENNIDNLKVLIQKITADTEKNDQATTSIVDYQWESDNLNALLSSNVAIVFNDKTGQVMYQKNAHTKVPLASITKLMAAMVWLDAKQDMSTLVVITKSDIDRLKNSGSRLTVGATLTKQELLHIGLMSSENRAIHALSRTYPGGESAFVVAMNNKARQLGMHNTVFYEPTGLDPRNRSTAFDIVTMARAAERYPLISHYTTDQYTQVRGKNNAVLTYKNTNPLVDDIEWNVGLQKTGYIKESGRCMVVKSKFGDDDVYLVFLGAPSVYARTLDAGYVQEVFGGRYY